MSRRKDPIVAVFDALNRRIDRMSDAELSKFVRDADVRYAEICRASAEAGQPVRAKAPHNSAMPKCRCKRVLVELVQSTICGKCGGVVFMRGTSA